LLILFETNRIQYISSHLLNMVTSTVPNLHPFMYILHMPIRNVPSSMSSISQCNVSHLTELCT